MTVTTYYHRRGDAIPFSAHVEDRLIGTTAESITVPAGANIVKISPTHNIGISASTLATAAADSTGDGLSSMQLSPNNDNVFTCRPDDVLSVISSTQAVVSVSFAFYLDPSRST